MIVSTATPSIWRRLPEDIWDRIEATLAASPPGQIFFRADDVAVPSGKQDRLLSMFSKHRMPLCCALVPAWLTADRWHTIDRSVAGRHEFFAWHQHGWTHRNHQITGKKQEFGSAVSTAGKRQAIRQGKKRLTRLLGPLFLPFFTPPWNRVDAETMEILGEEGFIGLSRFRGDTLPPVPGLIDIPVNVDLHTRKDATPEAGWKALLEELATALNSRRAGLMIHHQRMNEEAFSFLGELLERLGDYPHLTPVHFENIFKNK